MFLDQHDPETHLRQAEFGVGDHLLVCPITQPEAEGRILYLPKGDWFYYWTDEPTPGAAEVWAAADLSRIPLYVRAGAVLPLAPVMQYVGEKPVAELSLHVYYLDGQAESVLYDDGGDGYGYEQGERTTRRFTVTGDATSLTINQAIEGDYAPAYATYRVVLHGLPGTIATIAADGEAKTATEATLETGLQCPAVVVGSGFGEVRVRWAAQKSEKPANGLEKRI